MLGAIVGFTVEVTAMVGKFKASQNRAAEDRAGVRLGLAADGLSADAIAALVRDPTP
jgi:predicted FMN-binding regulatory protein PaiB